MSCLAPTYQSIFLELNPLEELRKTVGKLALDPIHKELANSLLDKIQDIQKAFELLAQTDKDIFVDELSDNVSNVVKSLKENIVEESEKQPDFVEVTPSTTYLLIISVFILISIFVLFGCKLYKSLMEKEKKREQKVKGKQLKKKK